MSPHIFPHFSLLRGLHLREKVSCPSTWSCLGEIALEFERVISYGIKGSMFPLLTLHRISFDIVVLVGSSLLIWASITFPSYLFCHLSSFFLLPFYSLIGLPFLISTMPKGREFSVKCSREF